jgi:hypothetical protein
MDFSFFAVPFFSEFVRGHQAGELHQGHLNADYLGVRIHRSVTIDSVL